MKTPHSHRFLALACATTVLAIPASASDRKSPNSPPVTYASASADVPAVPERAPAQWRDIKDIAYDQRGRFFAGLKRLEAVVELQVAGLTERRAAMNGSAYTKDWDFAMKEMLNSQAYLTSSGQELSQVSPEIWNQQKEKVGQAWVRTQDAYKKVRASTTSN